MTEPAAPRQPKDDLKLMGEIDKRVAKLGAAGKALLAAAIGDLVPVEELRLVEQIVERHAALSDGGKKFAESRLGID